MYLPEGEREFSRLVTLLPSDLEVAKYEGVQNV
jgi:hypothetical protein